GCARRRIRAHGDGSLLRSGSRRPRRGSDQGRAPRRRQHAPPRGGRRGLFPGLQPQQEEPCGRSHPSRGKSDRAQAAGTADVLTENFRPGALDKLGFSYEKLANPRLIYCSLKGFLKGPYELRPALDEVTQMMGGLAYMTGLPDRPLRAGSSVVDIMGGTFAAVAILAALRERETTGKGKRVTSALFESTA